MSVKKASEVIIKKEGNEVFFRELAGGCRCVEDLMQGSHAYHPRKLEFRYL